MDKIIKKTKKAKIPFTGRSNEGLEVGGLYFKEYNKTLEGENVRIEDDKTCEDVCVETVRRLNISPLMLPCFSLAIYHSSTKTWTWLAQTDKLTDSLQKSEIHFRMRFIPCMEKCQDLRHRDVECLRYLFWQACWDFLHDRLECYTNNKSEEAAALGVVVLGTLIMLRIDTEERGGTDEQKINNFLKKNPWNKFLPPSLQETFLDKVVLERALKKHLKETQEKYSHTQFNAVDLMRFYLDYILKENKSYYIEQFKAYDLNFEVKYNDSGNESYLQMTDTPEEFKVTVQMGCRSPNVKVEAINTSGAGSSWSCEVSELIELTLKEEVISDETWWSVRVGRHSGHQERLFFGDKQMAYSCVSCLESLFHLTCDYYYSICQEVEPSYLKEKCKISAHAPISDEFATRKLSKKKFGEAVYILRSNSSQHDHYEVLYNKGSRSQLQIKSIGKVIKIGDAYAIEGSERHTNPDLKQLIYDAVQNKGLVGYRERIKPQTEGCDTLHHLLLTQAKFTIADDESEKELERSKLESMPKVFMSQSVHLENIIGKGYFTEAYKAVLEFHAHEEDVVVKRLRDSELPGVDFRRVHQAFNEGVSKLLELNERQYFVSHLGIVQSSQIYVVLQHGLHGSLASLLQRTGHEHEPLKLHHLVYASTQLASALHFMDTNNYHHGNLHCDNIVVTDYDSSDITVKITDPGLVTLYNTLPLDGVVNRRRCPWLAPELYEDLSAMNIHTDMFAFGTTLWQMFSGGANPLDTDNHIGGYTVTQVKDHFISGNVLSLPINLQVASNATEEEKTHKLKYSLFEEIKKLWRKRDERPSAEAFLRDLRNHTQSYGSGFHEYSIIPSASLTSALYPLQSGEQTSASSRSHIQSSGVSVGMTTLRNTMPLNDLEHSRENPVNNLREPLSVNLPNNQVPPASARLNVELQRPGNANQVVPRNVSEPPRTALTSRSLSTPAPRSLGSRPLPSTPIVKDVRHLIQFDRLDLKPEVILGRGHYGEIKKGTLMPLNSSGVHENCVVAVKALKEEMVVKYSAAFLREASIMEELHHVNIVKFYGICNGGELIVMEFVENGSLISYLKKMRNKKDPAQQDRFGRDIAKGMEYLASHNIIHCDLAARNVLLTRDLIAKVSDFGLSKILSEDKDYYRRSNDGRPLPLLWCAPEWLGHQLKFTTKSDVWSFGVVLWEIYTYGQTPHLGDSTTKNFFLKLHENVRLPEPDDCPRSIYSLMMECWSWKPEQRPSFTYCYDRLKELCDVNYTVAVDNTQSNTPPTTTGTANIIGQSNASETESTNQNPGNASGDHPNIQSNEIVVDNTQSNTPPTTSGTATIIGQSNASETQSTNQNSGNASGDHANIQSNEVAVDNTQLNTPPNTSGTANIIGQSNASETDSTNQNPGNAFRDHANIQSNIRVTETPDHSGISTSSSNSSHVTGNGGHMQNEEQRMGDHSSSGAHSERTDIYIDNKNLILEKTDANRLGKGSFGEVYRATYKGTDVAVKFGTNEKQKKRFKREFSILCSLQDRNHPNIIKFIGLHKVAQTSGDNIEYVMEVMVESLSSRLHKIKDTVPKKLKILMDIAKGMEFLFERLIVHGDLHAENVLLSHDGTAKISDFGWAKVLDSGDVDYNYTRDSPEVKFRWAPLEVLCHHKYNRYSDIWSYGVVCLEVFTDGKEPNLSPAPTGRTNEEIANRHITRLRKGERYKHPDGCPDGVYDIMLNCWLEESKLRYKFDSIHQKLKG